MTRVVNYEITRGLPFERLIVLKDRRTHRLLKPTDCRAYVSTVGSAKMEITSYITSEQAIMLTMTGEETQDLPLGALSYDVLATVGGVQQPVAQGTITVSALNTVTPLEDAQAMEIRYKQRTDFRRTFTWKDADGDVLSIQSAFMQAKDANDSTVIDLRWFSTVPSEATIIALPSNRRGYLAPATGATLEMHLSDQMTVAAGTYNFDLFVQDSAGDWDCLASGTVVVEPSISVPPA